MAGADDAAVRLFLRHGLPLAAGTQRCCDSSLCRSFLIRGIIVVRIQALPVTTGGRVTASDQAPLGTSEGNIIDRGHHSGLPVPFERVYVSPRDTGLETMRCCLLFMLFCVYYYIILLLLLYILFIKTTNKINNKLIHFLLQQQL